MVSETTIASGVNRYLEMPVRNTIKMVMVVTSTGSALLARLRKPHKIFLKSINCKFLLGSATNVYCAIPAR